MCSVDVVVTAMILRLLALLVVVYVCHAQGVTVEDDSAASVEDSIVPSATRLEAKGEPKSGTTFLEISVYAAAKVTFGVSCSGLTLFLWCCWCEKNMVFCPFRIITLLVLVERTGRSLPVPSKRDRMDGTSPTTLHGCHRKKHHPLSTSLRRSKSIT